MVAYHHRQQGGASSFRGALAVLSVMLFLYAFSRMISPPPSGASFQKPSQPQTTPAAAIPKNEPDAWKDTKRSGVFDEEVPVVKRPAAETKAKVSKQTSEGSSSKTSPQRPSKISLSELASRIKPSDQSATAAVRTSIVKPPVEEDAEEDDDAEDEEDIAEEGSGAAKVAEAEGSGIDDDEEDDEEDEETVEKKSGGEVEQRKVVDMAGDGDEDDEEQEAAREVNEEDAEEEEEEKQVAVPATPARKLKPTAWEKFYESAKCKAFRSLPPGHGIERNLGQGQRSLCSRNQTEKQTIEYRTELGGSVDISIIHRAIYLPVMKAGSQMFQEVFKKRLRGRRILDREIPSYLKRFDLKLEDFFIFTFVREPLSTFVSAYGEVTKYTSRNRTFVKGFSDIEDKPENEPRRALAALEDIRKGTFHGLVPAHMHTQLWKISRCLPNREATEIKLNFIGHLENLDNDWPFVEQVLNIPHQDLPVIHSSKTSPNPIPKRSIKFDPPSSNARFSELTKEVCDYYRADFACFGYDDSICDQRR